VDTRNRCRRGIYVTGPDPRQTGIHAIGQLLGRHDDIFHGAGEAPIWGVGHKELHGDKPGHDGEDHDHPLGERMCKQALYKLIPLLSWRFAYSLPLHLAQR
jgi:hypothetical protein